MLVPRLTLTKLNATVFASPSSHPVATAGRTLQIGGDEEATSKCRIGAAEVGLLNLNLTALQSHEFLVGIAVAAIVVSALVASSLFRNIALALAAGAVVLLYLQGGITALVATSKVLETEIRAIPDFSQGLVVGLAISAVLLVGMRQRSS
jgi:hypothetical protein